ncbi:restriction endonuclease subunit S [Amycolatopsis thermoflava]
MTDLPPGWEWATLDDLGVYSNGRAFKRSEWSDSGRPIIRIQNLTGTSADFNFFSGELEEKHIARDGDLLIAWAASLGSHIWRGPEAAINQHIFKVQSWIDVKFHHYLVDHLISDLYSVSQGSGIVHVTRSKFGSLKVGLPPLAEQRRIVAAIEKHLSRIDAASSQVDVGVRRLRALEKRVIIEAVPIPAESHWRCVTVGEAGRVDLGRQRHPDWHTGPNMRPYLRVANVFEDRIDFEDVKEMDFPPDVFARFKVEPGDILLNEGQSPEYLGRPAMYRGEANIYAFTNSLLRFRANPDVLPDWALLVFRRHMHAGRFLREVRITTNIAHLSATRFKSVEFPIPPRREQEKIVSETKEKLENIARMSDSLRVGSVRAARLRRALLSDAFAGRLVAQDQRDEPAAVLLDRIRKERAAQPKPKRGRRASKPNQETLL